MTAKPTPQEECIGKVEGFSKIEDEGQTISETIDTFMEFTVARNLIAESR